MERTEEATRVLGLLEHARRRAAEAMPGSPEWEAAVAGVEELERQLDSVEAPREPEAPVATGDHLVVAFGPRSLADGQVVQGTLVGNSAVDAVSDEVAALAERVATRREFARELERLVLGRGYVLEATVGAWGGYVFYAWEREPAAE